MTKFCDQIDGEYKIRPDQPMIVRFPIERNPDMLNELRSAVSLYQETIAADRREVLRRYYFGDFARKVVGVGSVGTEDPFATAEQRQGFEAEMREAGVADWRLELYGGIGHSFTNPDVDQYAIPGCAYNAMADRRSWQSMLQLFGEVLT